jgi:hypothetical protein
VTATIRINGHSGLNPVEARISLDGLQLIRVMERDGTVLTEFDRPALVLLEPITQAA